MTLRKLACSALAVILLVPSLASAKKPRATATEPPVIAAAETSLPAQAVGASDGKELQRQLVAVQRALAAAQQAALADPALEATHEALQDAIDAALRAADPAFDAKLARLGVLELNVAAFRSAPQPEAGALENALAEGRALQQELAALQLRVVSEEPLATRIDEVRQQMLAKMTAADPLVPALVGRLEILVKRMD